MPHLIKGLVTCLLYNVSLVLELITEYQQWTEHIEIHIVCCSRGYRRLIALSPQRGTEETERLIWRRGWLLTHILKTVHTLDTFHSIGKYLDSV